MSTKADTVYERKEASGVIAETPVLVEAIIGRTTLATGQTQVILYNGPVGSPAEKIRFYIAARGTDAIVFEHPVVFSQALAMGLSSFVVATVGYKGQ